MCRAARGAAPFTRFPFGSLKEGGRTKLGNQPITKLNRSYRDVHHVAADGSALERRFLADLIAFFREQVISKEICISC